MLTSMTLPGGVAAMTAFQAVAERTAQVGRDVRRIPPTARLSAKAANCTETRGFSGVRRGGAGRVRACGHAKEPRTVLSGH